MVGNLSKYKENKINPLFPQSSYRLGFNSLNQLLLEFSYTSFQKCFTHIKLHIRIFLCSWEHSIEYFTFGLHFPINLGIFHVRIYRSNLFFMDVLYFIVGIYCDLSKTC